MKHTGKKPQSNVIRLCQSGDGHGPRAAPAARTQSAADYFAVQHLENLGKIQHTEIFRQIVSGVVALEAYGGQYLENVEAYMRGMISGLDARRMLS